MQAMGTVRSFRDELEARQLKYVVGITHRHKAWPPGSTPRLPKRTRAKGRPKTRYSDGRRKPRMLKEIAKGLGRSGYRKTTWSQGTKKARVSHCAAVRLRLAEGHTKRRPPSDEVWLIAEWPPWADAPTKIWISNLPKSTSKKTLIRVAKIRWRIERDYQELKEELGLDHFEGRGWRGFHHHAALCAAAHAFLTLRRALFPRSRQTSRWTVPLIRARMQVLLIRRLGHCPLCQRDYPRRTGPAQGLCWRWRVTNRHRQQALAPTAQSIEHRPRSVIEGQKLVEFVRRKHAADRDEVECSSAFAAFVFSDAKLASAFLAASGIALADVTYDRLGGFAQLANSMPPEARARPTQRRV